MDKIVKAFNQTYKGKRFVYKSKYGRVIGRVECIFSGQSFIMDEDREMSLLYHVNHSVKGDGKMEKPELKGTEKYMAFQPTFKIKSTNGVMYDLDECYFIEE